MTFIPASSPDSAIVPLCRLLSTTTKITWRELAAATETVASNQFGEALDYGFKQAAGRWQQAVSNPGVFLSRLLLPAAYCLLPASLQLNFLEATRIVSWKGLARTW
jgi:hypothetical protein